MAFSVKEAHRVGDSIEVVLANGKDLRYLEYEWDKNKPKVGDVGPKRFPTFASFRAGVRDEVKAQLKSLNSKPTTRTSITF